MILRNTAIAVGVAILAIGVPAKAQVGPLRDPIRDRSPRAMSASA